MNNFRTKSYWIDLLRSSIDENEDEEELSNDEIMKQSLLLSQKWFQKSSNARRGVAE
jgi:hypothetical protein